MLRKYVFLQLIFRYISLSNVRFIYYKLKAFSPKEVTFVKNAKDIWDLFSSYVILVC